MACKHCGGTGLDPLNSSPFIHAPCPVCGLEKPKQEIVQEHKQEEETDCKLCHGRRVIIVGLIMGPCPICNYQP